MDAIPSASADTRKLQDDAILAAVVARFGPECEPTLAPVGTAADADPSVRTAIVVHRYGLAGVILQLKADGSIDTAVCQPLAQARPLVTPPATDDQA